MSVDSHRLVQLEKEKGTQQYGESVTVPVASSPAAAGLGLSLLAKDLVRIRGDKTDINAWRIYLSPWAVQPSMTIPAGGNDPGFPYAFPTPWQPPQPILDDNFQLPQYYARIEWGAGGCQNIAYVDWQARGSVLQISGSYVQVNAAVYNNFGTNNLLDPTRLPTLRASCGPEPGGGDSARPATFTYPKQNGSPIPPQPAPPTGRRWHFQIPPFARAFFPLVDVSNLFRNGTFTELRIATQPAPQPISGAGFDNAQSWFYVAANPQLQGVDWPLEPFPIAGQLLSTVGEPIVARNGACVTIEIDDTAAFSPGNFTRMIGCMFDLDL